jgi:predicted MFS family arabinose efflux permease
VSSSLGLWAATVGIGVLYMGSTMVTPLYPLYRKAFGFSELTVTAIYAVYVVGNLAVLVFFGRLSDQIGRRAVTLAALGLTAASALCFLFATSTAWLVPARILNGFAAGLGAGALTAWTAELEPEHDRARASTIASAGNLAGLALGPVIGGLLAQFGPWPLRTSYVAYLASLGAMILVVRATPETVARPARRLAAVSLRPRIGVPAGIRLRFAAAAAMAFAAFALCGFFAALLPGVLARSLHESHPAVVGAVVGAFFGTAVVVVPITRAVGSRAAMGAALAFLLAGLGSMLGAEVLRSVALLLVGTFVGGVAMALAYRSSLQTVNEIAPEAQRAEVISSYLAACYTGNALPILGVGALSIALGPTTTHAVFAGLLALLGVAACVIVYSRAGAPASAENGAGAPLPTRGK